MNQRLLIISLFFCLAVLPVQAHEVDASGVPVEGEQESTGEVTITDGGQQLINEFRINGQLYMIRITPKKGVPYYLVDSDGDGDLETRWNELAPEILIPSWVLLRW